MLPMQSEHIGELAAALSKAKAEFPLIRKTKRANYGEYADTFDILGPIIAIMEKHGLSIVVDRNFYEGREILVGTLMHSSDQWMKSYAPLRDNLVKDADWGGTSTFRSRYIYKEMLGIAIPDDVDDNDDNHAVVNAEELEYLLSLSSGWQSSIKERNNITDLSQLPRAQFTGIVNYIKSKERNQVAR